MIIKTMIPKIKKSTRIIKEIGFKNFIRFVIIKLKEKIITNYPTWVLRFESEFEELKNPRYTNDSQCFPKISLVLPAYKTPVRIIQQTIQSVLNQSYSNWELCIANGSPEDEALTNQLQDYSQRDPRIKIKTLLKNLGIAGNTNAAIQMAEGEFIAFLDHDDTLAPFALYEVVKAIDKYPESDLLFSDEDYITYLGNRRYNPFFKPAFSIDYLRFINYMCHFLVIRKELGDKVGWLRAGFDGAQDFDLILRCVEQARLVTHIPKVLYHWRSTPESTAGDIDNKPYSTQAGIAALQDHIKRMGYTWQVQQGPVPTSYYLKNLTAPSVKISIIIPNHNHFEDLKICIESILKKTSYPNYEIVIVENNSTEEALFAYYAVLKENSKIRILTYNETPFNFSTINNFAVAQCDSEVLLFLNNDMEVINSDWLERMAEHVLRSEVGAVGAKLYYLDKSIQHAGVIVGIGGVAGHSHKGSMHESLGKHGRLKGIQNLSAVTAACLMVRREVFEEIEGFDPAFQLAFNDIDFCLRLRKEGYLIVWTPLTELYHFESKTRGYEDTDEKQMRFNKEVDLFQKRWDKFLLEGDPYYSPWLTLEKEDFTFAIHPRELHPRAMLGLGK